MIGNMVVCVSARLILRISQREIILDFIFFTSHGRPFYASNPRILIFAGAKTILKPR